jgi:hypothetical protein
MTTVVPTGGWVIPLLGDQRAAYEALYDKNEIAIQNTTDIELLKPLNEAQLNIGNLLSADDQFHIEQNAATFKAVADAIGKTNHGLKELQGKKIGEVAKKIPWAADVLVGVNKVLSFPP